MDRNANLPKDRLKIATVALRKESVDRNFLTVGPVPVPLKSLSARRAWIEICVCQTAKNGITVALRKESVDRNVLICVWTTCPRRSLSARRAWIEIMPSIKFWIKSRRRSPQGERG